MTALGKLFGTTAFRLATACLLVFALFAGIVLGYVAHRAGTLLDEQVQLGVDVEMQGLVEQYELAGPRRLVATVEERSRVPGAPLYLVTTPSGEMLAGNVESVLPGVLRDPGARETLYLRPDDTEARPAYVRVRVLSGGLRLLVGRDLEERQELREVIRGAFGLSLGLVALLGGLAAWFVARRVLGRVDAMTGTTRAIMAGDLSGRLAVAGTGDELDRLALALNAMLDRIAELMAGLEQVSDNIAHDLKTPLTRLRNRAEGALRPEAGADDHRRALEAVIEEADGLIRVFNALLTIHRAEAGTTGEGMAAFDLGEVARGIAELYEPVAEEVGVPLAVEAAPGLTVHGNRELVGQALANLLDNAIKHGLPAAANENQAGVLVRAGRAGDRVELSVADRGAGVPAAERARVLDRFVRLEASRSRPGFGLGLSLAAAIARLHGGALRLEDNAPGLKAVIALPAARAA